MSCTSGPQSHLSIAVPAYFMPGAAWDMLAAAVPPVSIVVLNPDNGPGPTADPAYAAVVKAVQRRGGRVLGYIHTEYGARAAVAVRADVDHYLDWYGVDGIFFDEASTDCAVQPMYAALDAYLKARAASAVTVLNPGAPAAECYMTAADVIVMFEGSYAAYRGREGRDAAPPWVRRYAPARFWHIVFAAPSATAMQGAAGLARSRHAGYIYITSGNLPNPYEDLPDGYWLQEVAIAR